MRILLSAFCSVLMLSPFHLAQAEEKTRIGVSLPLTGPASTYGVDVQNVLRFTNDRVLNGRYELVFEDDRCHPRDAVSIAHKFTSTAGIRYVLGFPCSGTVLAAAPIYERTKTLVIAALASAPEVASAGEYIYRARPSDHATMVMMAGYLAARHRVVGILTEETEYPQAMKRDLLRELGERVRIVEEDFFTEATDLKALLLKMRGVGVEGLVVLGQTEQSAALAVRQAHELRLGIPLYGSNAMSSSAFLRLAGAAAEGVVVMSLPPTEHVLTPEGKELYGEFLAIHGEPSVDWAFYCAVESLRALDAALGSGKDPREFLNSSSFKGVFGEYRFDPNGDLVGLRPSVRVVRDGKFVEL